MRQILPYVDVVIANGEDCHDVLGIPGETDVHKEHSMSRNILM